MDGLVQTLLHCSPPQGHDRLSLTLGPPLVIFHLVSPRVVFGHGVEDVDARSDESAGSEFVEIPFEHYYAPNKECLTFEGERSSCWGQRGWRSDIK